MGSSPNWVDGQIPSAGDWNATFTGKADDVPFAGDAGMGGIGGQVPVPPAGSGAAGFVLKAWGGWGPVSSGPGGSFLWTIQYAAPLSGDDVVSDGSTVLILEPAGELAALTVTLPSAPVNGQFATFNTSEVLDAVTVGAPGGASVKGTMPFVMTPSGGVGFVYREANTTWYRMF